MRRSCLGCQVMVWDAHKRQNILKGKLGFKCRCVAYSQENYLNSTKQVRNDPRLSTQSLKRNEEGYHLAVGGKLGRVAILDAEDLRPIVLLHDSKEVCRRPCPASSPLLLSRPHPPRVLCSLLPGVSPAPPPSPTRRSGPSPSLVLRLPVPPSASRPPSCCFPGSVGMPRQASWYGRSPLQRRPECFEGILCRCSGGPAETFSPNAPVCSLHISSAGKRSPLHLDSRPRFLPP